MSRQIRQRPVMLDALQRVFYRRIKTKDHALPTKLSDAIELAIKDQRAFLRGGGRVYMSDWVSSRTILLDIDPKNDKKACTACLAGASLFRRIDGGWDGDFVNLTPEQRGIAKALNYVRYGEWCDALWALHGQSIPEEVQSMIRYDRVLSVLEQSLCIHQIHRGIHGRGSPIVADFQEKMERAAKRLRKLGY